MKVREVDLGLPQASRRDERLAKPAMERRRCRRAAHTGTPVEVLAYGGYEILPRGFLSTPIVSIQSRMSCRPYAFMGLRPCSMTSTRTNSLTRRTEPVSSRQSLQKPLLIVAHDCITVFYFSLALGASAALSTCEDEVVHQRLGVATRSARESTGLPALWVDTGSLTRSRLH